MPPKRHTKKLTQGRRRRRTILPPRSADDATRARQVHQAGADLMKRLLVMFSVCKLSPADLCICCYHLALMDAPGADWQLSAYPPDRNAHVYQAHLDTDLPGVGPFYHVDTPIWKKGGERVTKSIPTACLWQRLRREFEANSDLAQTLECSSDATPDVMKTAAYKSHPKVKASIDNDDPLPLPLAIYLDAVAFSSALAGRSDSILGLWVINLISDKRHMFCVVRLLDMCRCGCKGRCTMFPLLLTLQWELIALQSGAPPLCRHDLSAWDFGDAMGDMEFFSFICVLIWIKGDWAEFAHTLALQSWSSFFNPCFCCKATKEEMHTLYRDVSLDSLPFVPRLPCDYERSCAKCEVLVRITTNLARTRIVDHLLWMVGKKWKGRTIKADLQIDGQPLLLAGDRLEPSQQLMDVGALHLVPLPLTVVFWRVSRLEDQVTDAVHHRCPLFCEELHTDPVGTIVIDTLHTLYYGPIMRWTSAALHRVVAANPWGIRGGVETIRDIV